jgi:hypothetical protein
MLENPIASRILGRNTGSMKKKLEEKLIRAGKQSTCNESKSGT